MPAAAAKLLPRSGMMSGFPFGDNARMPILDRQAGFLAAAASIALPGRGSG